jgi:biopolymer transport protein ExbD
VLPEHTRSIRLFRGIDVSALASILVVLAFVMLAVAWMPPTHGHHAVDLAHVGHPVPMPGAGRDDVLLVSVTRNGRVYFRSDEIMPADLADRIRDRLKDREVERKVYIQVDMRAKWGMVKVVLDGVRSAGILRVAFLADQRRSLPSLP